LGMREVQEQLAEMDAVAHVRGSCETCLQQAHAVAHGLAHALGAHDRELRESLREAGFGGRKVGRGMRFGDEETR
jgi:ribosomal protein S9